MILVFLSIPLIPYALGHTFSNADSAVKLLIAFWSEPVRICVACFDAQLQDIVSFSPKAFNLPFFTYRVWNAITSH